jgi:hypothetical protein
MATVLDLAQASPSTLFRLDPGFEGADQEFRCIFTNATVKAWIQNELPNLTSPLGLELSPQEQMFALVDIFCSDKELSFGDHFKPLRCRGQGVWELRTEDLRIFGWFPLKDHFVAVAANDATFIKDHKLYEGYIGAVVRFRYQLDLDEPKFIQGDNPDHVVSNYCCP